VSAPVDGIEITAATAVDDELVAAIGRLIPQLSRLTALPTKDVLG